MNHLWMAGFLTAQQVYGGGDLPMLLLDGATIQPGDEEKFRNWQTAHEPDCIIGIYPDVAWGWLQSSARRAGADVSYASMDLFHDQIGRIAGIRQDWDSMVSAAVDMLVGGLFRNEYGIPSKPKLMLLEGQWKDGASAPFPEVVAETK